jgi:GNAT superfamily N-acetyltransferase
MVQVGLQDQVKINLMLEYELKFRTFPRKKIPETYYKQLFRCSYGFMGCMWVNFKKHYKSDKSKITVCLKNNKVIAWGLLYKNPTKYCIMLYVYKKYRRKKIGKKIFNRLARNLDKNQITVYKDSSNKDFFKSVIDKSKNKS